MENKKRRNVTIRLTDDEIELFDELRHLRAKIAGCPISRSAILMEALEFGYLTVLENVTTTAEKFALFSHSENRA